MTHLRDMNVTRVSRCSSVSGVERQITGCLPSFNTRLPFPIYDHTSTFNGDFERTAAASFSSHFPCSLYTPSSVALCLIFFSSLCFCSCIQTFSFTISAHTLGRCGMSFHLPVSSFPDAPPHALSATDTKTQIIVTPPPAKIRIPYLGRVLGKDTSRPATPSIMPDAEPKLASIDTVADVSTRSAYPRQSEAPTQCPMIVQSFRPSFDVVNHHGPHHRSTSGALLGYRSSWIDQYPEYRAPRSTKESIAVLGLSRRRTPSPDSSSSSDSDSMVACCYSSGWVEPQALPPLPPIPPPSPPPFSTFLNPPARSSSLGCDVKESFKILSDVDVDNKRIDIESVDEVCSERSSTPPSPITFSHRNSAFITMESSAGISDIDRPTLTTIPLSTDSTLRWQSTSCSPPPSSPVSRKAAENALSVEFAADVSPFANVTHVSAAALFASSPKLLKPGQPLPSTSSPTVSKLSVKMPTWKIFYKRSGDESSPQTEATATPVEPRSQSQTRCPLTSRRKRRHRNSIHLASISSLHTESSTTRRSSIGSDRTQNTAQETAPGGVVCRVLKERKSMNTLRSVTTHRVAGDQWQIGRAHV